MNTKTISQHSLLRVASASIAMAFSLSKFSWLARPHFAAKHIGFVIAAGGAAWVMKFAAIVGTHDAEFVEPMAQVLWLMGMLLPIGFAWGVTYALARRASWLGRSVAFLVSLIALAALIVGWMSLTHDVAHLLLHDAPHYLIEELPVLLTGCAGLALAPLFWIEWEIKS